MSLGKAQIIHIVVEVIVLIAVSMYFQTQNKKLKQDIEGLKTILQKHDQALKILFSNVNIKKVPSFPQSQQQPSSVASSEPVPKESDTCCTIPEEDEEQDEFDKQVQEEVNKVNQEIQEKKKDESEIDFDITESSTRNNATGSAIDTILVIGQDNEDEDDHPSVSQLDEKSQDVHFLPSKPRKRTKKKD